VTAEEALLRTGLAALLGALVGLERELRGQHAGMRTHTLVCVGAALFTFVGAYGFGDITRGPNTDPMRVAAQIVSGIGFIGAGAILRDGESVRGVTTAASLWASAAIGMAVGAGLVSVALVGAAVVLVALHGLRLVREHGLARFLGRQQDIDIVYRRGSGTLGPVMQALERGGADLERLQISDEVDRRHVSISISVRDPARLRSQLDRLVDLPEVDRVLIDGRAG
jgi:putative Mg2+ transporter-C (MgtC) family protein